MVIPAGVLGSIAGLATLGVLGMDLTYALRDEAQPTNFAVANLVLGLVDLAGGIALALGGTETFLGFGLGFGVAGLVMVIDAIVAFAMGPPRPIDLAVSVSSDGFVAMAVVRL